jgi:hypothetical protein
MTLAMLSPPTTGMADDSHHRYLLGVPSAVRLLGAADRDGAPDSVSWGRVRGNDLRVCGGDAVSRTTITYDEKRSVPLIWTDKDCIELFEHARHLGHNGNPAGYALTRNIFPFVGYEDEAGRHLKWYDEWDYAGIRSWIVDHENEVLRVCRLQVTRVW